MLPLIFWMTETFVVFGLWNSVKKSSTKRSIEQRNQDASGCLALLLIPIALLILNLMCKLYGG
jgi:hypothetical protein